jgi:hypothetical protein
VSPCGAYLGESTIDRGIGDNPVFSAQPPRPGEL